MRLWRIASLGMALIVLTAGTEVWAEQNSPAGGGYGDKLPEKLPEDTSVQKVELVANTDLTNFDLTITAPDADPKGPAPVRPWGIRRIHRLNLVTVEVSLEEGGPIQLTNPLAKSCAHIDGKSLGYAGEKKDLHFLLEPFVGLVRGAAVQANEIAGANEPDHGVDTFHLRLTQTSGQQGSYFIGGMVVFVDQPVKASECLPPPPPQQPGATPAPPGPEPVEPNVPRQSGVFSQIIWRTDTMAFRESDGRIFGWTVPKEVVVPSTEDKARVPRLDGPVFLRHQFTDGFKSFTVAWDMPGLGFDATANQAPLPNADSALLTSRFSTYVRHATNGGDDRTLGDPTYKIRWRVTATLNPHDPLASRAHGNATIAIEEDGLTNRNDHPPAVAVNRGSLDRARKIDEDKIGWNKVTEFLRGNTTSILPAGWDSKDP